MFNFSNAAPSGGWEDVGGASFSLYIHVPFCVKKCGYCDFYSFNAEGSVMDSYTDMLCNMLPLLPNGGGELRTIYFGGGTPSLLGSRRIGKILSAIKARYNISLAEVTLECNPELPEADFFSRCRELGVNRVSIGLQSAVPEELSALMRSHSPEQVINAVTLCQGAGIDNISLDIMLGLPGQTIETLDRTIDFCHSLLVPHISAYILKAEPGTPFYEGGGCLTLPDDELTADLYLHAVKRLLALGFVQYEISNFARGNLYSRHNMAYWQLLPYIGLGPSAHSYYGGRRRFFERDLGSLLAAKSPFSLWRDDGPGGGREENIMLSLRLSSGIPLSYLGSGLTQAGQAKLSYFIKTLIRHSLGRVSDETLSLSPQGFLISNSIISELLSILD